MKASVLRFTLFLAVSVTLFSCGSSRFSQKRYGHRDWIKVEPNSMEKMTGSVIDSDQKDEIKGEAKQEDLSGEIASIREELSKEETPVMNESPLTAENKIKTQPLAQNTTDAKKEKKSSFKITNGKLAMVKAPLNTIVAKPLKKITENTGDNTSGGESQILIIILAILLPPVGVYLYEGVSTMFWITLILCLLSFSFFFGPHYVGSLWFIAMILALLRVLGAI